MDIISFQQKITTNDRQQKTANKEPANKGPPTPKKLLDTGYAGRSLSNELSNNLKDTTWKYINKALNDQFIEFALKLLCLCVMWIVNAEDLSEKMIKTKKINYIFFI